MKVLKCYEPHSPQLGIIALYADTSGKLTFHKYKKIKLFLKHFEFGTGDSCFTNNHIFQTSVIIQHMFYLEMNYN